MFYTIYLYHCCSINGKYCCSGYRWDKIQKACVRKCHSYNTDNIILNCKFKNSWLLPNIHLSIFLVCTSGYTGINCNTKCIYPQFGQNCQSFCNCTEEHCDHMDGCRNSPGKTIENICSGYVFRCFIRNLFWSFICKSRF